LVLRLFHGGVALRLPHHYGETDVSDVWFGGCSLVGLRCAYPTLRRYDIIVDMEDINPEFANTDVSLVIGANDVVNPVAKTDPTSPIYGMPILDVVNSRNTIVIKRGKGTGFAGIENALFYADNTRMLYGDGAEMASALVSELKALDGEH
jgi:NAD(P) transhydrogenase beta subunit